MSSPPDACVTLLDRIRERQVVLFVGSGVSATLGLPPWRGLIEQMGSMLEYDVEVFMQLGDFPVLAEYYERVTQQRALISDWMRAEWHSSEIERALLRSALHRSIAALRFPAIYTTNYDHWLERAHELVRVPFRKVLDSFDMAGARDSETIIYKFHGDLDDEVRGPLVLTESDYFERLSFNNELDIRLASDMLSRSLLFVGYSLSDVDLRAMLHRLERMRAGSRGLVPRSYIVLAGRNHVDKVLADSWNIDSLYLRGVDRGLALTQFFEQLFNGEPPDCVVDSF